jgi:hypothetical protein
VPFYTSTKELEWACGGTACRSDDLVSLELLFLASKSAMETARITAKYPGKGLTASLQRSMNA